MSNKHWAVKAALSLLCLFINLKIINYSGAEISSLMIVVTSLISLYVPYYFDYAEYSPRGRYLVEAHRFFERCGLIMYGTLFQSIKLKVTNISDIRKHKQVIFACHPHGVMSYHHAMLYMNVPGSEEIIKLIPLEKRRALAARSLFSIPILRDILLLSGAVDASAPVAKKCLSCGYSLTILPGGEREQLMAQLHEHKIFIKNRKGFCKLALQHNVPVIPCYCFGETDTYKTSTFMYSFRQWLAKSLFIAIPIPAEWLGFYPRHVSLNLVVGDPIDPQEILLKNTSTSSTLSDRQFDAANNEKILHEHVNEMHTKYIAVMQKLFDDNKLRYGCSADTKLEIL